MIERRAVDLRGQSLLARVGFGTSTYNNEGIRVGVG